MKARNILAVLFFVLTIYSFAGGTLLGIVNYPTWKNFNAADFPAIHQAVDRTINIYYVPIVLLSVLTNILLIWFRPPAMPRPWVVIAAVLNVFIWIVSATLAIPIQSQLDHAKSMELIDRLIMVHLYLRVFPGILLMFVTSVLLYKGLKPASMPGTST